MRKSQSSRVALCGVLGALSVVLMLLGNIVPLATYCAPMLAAMLLIPLVEEFTPGTALLLYAAVAILSMLILPDKEPALIYALVLGYDPVLKRWLDARVRFRPVRILCKLTVFNLGLIVAYLLLLTLFGAPGLAEEFAQAGRGLLLAMLAMGNLAFVIFDRALEVITLVYRRRLRPTLKKTLHI